MSEPAYRVNDTPTGAPQFYAVACDPSRSVAVQACAGSGKTWMLVSRIVRALLDGAQPHEILAITFTRRAAGEMRQRLHETLRGFAKADPATLRLELAARGVGPGLPPAQIDAMAGRLAGLHEALLASGRPVQMRTFHSWFYSLLTSAPVAMLQRLNLPGPADLLEDTTAATMLAWRRFYDVLEGNAALKADFDAAVFTHGRHQTEKSLEAALTKHVEFALADAHGHVERAIPHFSEQFSEFAGLDEPAQTLAQGSMHQRVFRDAARTLGGSGQKKTAEAAAALEAALAAGDLAAVIEALLTQGETPRKLDKALMSLQVVQAAQEQALHLLAATRQHEAWLHQQRMCRLTRALVAEYAALKRERGWVDMSDLERAALELLHDAQSAGWVQERLDARVRHLLIDEFQDTSPLQWHALHAWLSGYAGAGERPGVFIVGDPKQSIYRFRRAEPAVFRAAREFVREGLDGDVLSCDHTRRNATGVLELVNTVMAAARRDDGYDDFREHTTEMREHGRTGRLPPIARPDNATPGLTQTWRDTLTTPRELAREDVRVLEARQAAAWVAARLGEGVRAHEVMVLARSRASLQPLLEALGALGVAAQIADKTRLYASCEVQDLVALLDVLVSPRHDLSLARVLKSPLFSLADEQLVPLALLRRRHGPPWFDLLCDAGQQVPALRTAADTLARWKNWVDRLPPHDALQAIYDDGDVLARYAAAVPAAQCEPVLDDLRALLTAALEIDGGRHATPYRFVRALKSGDTVAPPSANPGAVRLLTIHGAKGLEADVVLLLDTDRVDRNAETMTVLVDWPAGQRQPRRFIFLASEKNPPPSVAPLLLAEQAARQREELNLLYVAMTRARHALVVSSIVSARPDEISWWDRMKDALAEEAAPMPLPGGTDAAGLAASAGKAGTAQLLQLPQRPPGAAGPAADTQAQTDAGTQAAHIGSAMHRLLQWGELTLSQRDAAAREFKLDAEQAGAALAMASRIRHGEAAWAWDASLVDWQGDEVELLYGGESLRVDRLVRRADSGEWWVLDYKSAAQPGAQPALLARMAQYRAAVRAAVQEDGAPPPRVQAAFLTADGAMLPLREGAG